jgi:hypothetical protein
MVMVRGGRIIARWCGGPPALATMFAPRRG